MCVTAIADLKVVRCGILGLCGYKLATFIDSIFQLGQQHISSL